MDPLLQTIDSIARGFVAQLPLIGLALIVLVVSLALASVLGRAAERALDGRDAALGRMARLVTQAVLAVAGVLLAIWVALPTVRFTDVFASLGVTGLILGFALRDIIENFVAGFLILWRQPFVVGDQIRSGEHEGLVVEVNFRSTVLRRYDGVRVTIPNGLVFTEPVENRTANERIRIEVELGIDQGASVTDARRVILETLRAMPEVLDDPAPTVLFESIADFTNNLSVLAWTEPPTKLEAREVRSAITERLNTALQEAGIGFPFPTQSLQLRAREPIPVRVQP